MKAVMRRCMLFVVVAFIALTPALTSQAQGNQRCFGLSDADCQLWHSGTDRAAMDKYSSYVMDYNIMLKASGMGNSAVDFAVTGNGPFSIDRSKAGTGDPLAALATLKMQNTLTASLNTGKQSQKGTLEFRILDSKLYFKGDVATKDQWMMVALDKAVNALMTNPMFSSAINAARGRKTGQNTPLDAINDPELRAAIQKIPDIPGFIKAERQVDITIDGEKAAQFVLTIDFLTLVKSKEFAPLVKAAAKSRPNGQAITDRQVQQFVAIAQTVLKDTKLSITQYVGTTDKLSHGVAIDFAMKIDENTAALLQRNSSSTGAASPIDITFHFDVKLSKIGQPVTVEAVSGAKEIDLSSRIRSSTSVATPAK